MFIDPTGMEIEETGDEDALKQLVSHVFGKKVEARIRKGKVTLHKAGAEENDTGLDSEADKDFINDLDAGQQIIFGVLNNAIQDSETTTLETFESSESIATGRWGVNKQQIDVSDMLTMEKKSGGYVSAGGQFAHEVEEAYQQQVKGNSYAPRYAKYGKPEARNNGHNMGLDVQGRIGGYTIVANNGDVFSKANAPIMANGEYIINDKGTSVTISYSYKNGEVKKVKIKK